jgi:hypothetical protein
VQKANAEIKLKQATGEMDWEQSAIEASKDSWKDELWTIVFVAILLANFIPSMQDVMAVGFANLETTPLWVQWGMYASIAASFGIRTMRGLKK